jgi:hypothetical protein
MSDRQIRGIIRGKTIELEHDLGMPEGQQVTITVLPLADEQLAPGEGLRRAFGAWADDAEGLDQYLAWSRQQRKRDRPEIEP